MAITNKRIARSLVTVIFLTLLNTVGGPLVTPRLTTSSAEATTPGITTDGLVLDWNAADSADRAIASGVVPTYTASAGGYYDLNGSTQYIFPDAATAVGAVGNARYLSVFMWVYPKGAGQLLTQQNTKTINAGYHTAIMEFTSADQLHVGLWNGTDQTSVNLSTTIATPKNNWYLVGLVYDGSKINGYINGVFAGSTSNFTYVEPAAAFYGIGANDVTNITVPESKGNMRVGSLYVYSKALNATEAANNFAATNSRFGPTIATPSNQSSFVNRTATFTATACSAATSGSLTCTYQWQQSTDGGITFTDISGATGLAYTTPILSAASHESRYRIKATDPGTGSSSATDLYSFSAAATLTVTTPPGSDTDTAMTFDGTSQYLRAPDANTFDISDSITVQAWVYQTRSIGTGYNMVVNKENSYQLGTVDGIWTYALRGSGWTGVSTGIPSKLNEWQHVAFTRATGSNTVRFYLNGNLAFTGSADGAGTGQINNSSNSLTISGRDYGNNTIGAYFQGQIDELRIFAADRTQAQIASDMNTYGPINTPTLRVYYDFNEESGSTIYNRRTGALAESDLTLYNAPTWSTALIETTTISTAYTVKRFFRSYITSSNGWKVPAGFPAISVLVVGGGGGGGYNSGGGGSGGGLLFTPRTVVSGTLTVNVGMGGEGASASGSLPFVGGSSTFGSITSAGGNPGGNYPTSQLGGDGVVTATGTSGAGGGGASSSSTSGSAGSTGLSSSITGTSTAYGGGGGGGGWNANTGGGAGGDGGGGAGGITNSQAGKNGTANSGGGGGGGSSSTVVGGDGGSGIIIIRYITASKPSFTPPTIAYLNAGMTETFTTNVAQDSATVTLTRTFRWESSTSGVNGPYSVIKQGIGAANAFFSWVPQDTRTSGSTFAFRVIVTDSDTAGLFIVETSTPVWAIINQPLSVTGTSAIAKRINLSRSETFTITLGTPTYRATLTPDAPGITLDTSTAGSAIIRLSDTLTVGTYYETLTVIDSVSASVVTPLIITVSAPPNLLNSAEIVSDDLVFHLEAGNSASIIGESGTATTGLTWNDISGGRANASTGAGVNTGAGSNTSCTAPTYSGENGGSLQFAGNSNNCYYASSFTGRALVNNYTVEAWFKTSATLPANAGLVAQATPASNVPTHIFIQGNASGGLIVGFYDQINTANRFANCPYTPVIGAWTHISGTYDGTTLTTYINGASSCTATQSYTISGSANTQGIIIGKNTAGTTNASFPGSIASIRMYDRALTAAQILSNFNATRYRFDVSNNLLVAPTKKYGATFAESFTVTSGSGARTIAFTTGDRAGIDWDTSTVANRINLSLQESMTVGTFYDTITVTDGLGQSTFLPISMSTTKADSLTVTMSSATTVVYNGSQISVYPRATVTGLKWSDTATSLTRFSSSLYTESTVVPTNADTYTVRGAIPTFTLGSIDNYLGVIYETSTATITRAFQRPLNIFMYGGVVGSPYLIWLQGGSGTGAVTETLTGVSSLSGCAISNRFLSASDQRQGFCEVRVVKAGDQNYFSETQTVQLYFMAYISSQPTGQVGSGATIGLNGATSLETSTVLPPAITSLSSTTISVGGGGTFTINGSGFNAGGLVVKFWRNKVLTPTGTTATTITFNISDIGAAGATSGRISVLTINGQAVSVETLTINP